MPSTSSTSLRRALFWGRPRDRRRHWRLFVGWYVLAMLALFALFFLFDRVLAPVVGEGIGDYLYSPVLPVALFYSPPFVSAASAYREGGLATSLVVGVAPSLVFGAVVSLDVAVRFLVTGEYVIRGDAPLWGLMLVFGLLGLLGAVAGFLVGTVGRVAVRRVRSR
jgi:hypothetical protein